MAFYSASMIEKGLFSGKAVRGAGSFANINIDGRLNLDAAIEIARDVFKKECNANGREYLGFTIEKTEKFLDYRTPVMVDTDLKAKDIEFLF